jgi:hypothetical protein
VAGQRKFAARGGNSYLRFTRKLTVGSLDYSPFHAKTHIASHGRCSFILRDFDGTLGGI